jgi:hypothetical protein
VVEEGVVCEMKKGRQKHVVVSNHSELRDALMFEFHYATGHGGAAKT